RLRHPSAAIAPGSVVVAGEQDSALAFFRSALSSRAMRSEPPPGDGQPPGLVALDEDWAIWPWFVVRGAGFPAALALELSSPACARIADRIAEVEREARERLSAAART